MTCLAPPTDPAPWALGTLESVLGHVLALKGADRDFDAQLMIALTPGAYSSPYGAETGEYHLADGETRIAPYLTGEVMEFLRALAAYREWQARA